MQRIETEPLLSGASQASLSARTRPIARGKFLFVDDSKYYVRGVTYGTFRPGADGVLFPPRAVVDADFTAMARSGINTVRTYTVPPSWLLDLAALHGLRVVVGIPWEQHVAFLDDRSLADSIENRIREGVRAGSSHPAILCYVIGNEIPASIVRWHGRGAIERFLERLYRAAKEEDPDALVTYVNYPSTEYLQLRFLDFVCFNIFLEAEEDLEAYLARLQNLSGERPLVVTELGLDSLRNGEDGQAVALDWQIRAAFRGGCAGCIAFAWTDEWHRGGVDIEDWRFGLTDGERRPKPALAAVREAFAESPFRQDLAWPRVSVVVCSRNGTSTLVDCLEGVTALDYPDYEVILVDDGSTDGTAELGRQFGVRTIRMDHGGLSSARNLGLELATGEIVAYLDDDCRPDRDWLTYLAATFMVSPHVGVGGPNLAPEGDGPIADCVAAAPGGPIHVLVSDREAEHIPGCNMAFRRKALLAIGGFDRQFWVAGDDVDICWRLQQEGWTLGFSPAAVVWHHRRNSLRAYLRQQRGYGRAEALLERKWPEKYNRGGQLRWRGRVYSNAYRPTGRRWRIYYGTWGSGLFQSVYQRTPTTLTALPLMPEWYLLLGLLLALSAYELAVGPILFRTPVVGIPSTPLLFGLCAAIVVVQASLAGFRSAKMHRGQGPVRLKRYALTGLLHLLQPLARLSGRVQLGLTPWRRVSALHLATPRPRTVAIWSESWRGPGERLVRLEAELRRFGGATVSRGSEFDRWDMEVRTGLLGVARLRLGVEEHGEGRQLLRFRIWPRASRGAMATVVLLVILLFATGHEGRGADLIIAAGAALTALWMVRDCAAAVAVLRHAVDEQQQAELDGDSLAVELTRRAGATAEHDAPPVGALNSVRSYAVGAGEVEN
jgi:GT2 family glycosyltransferase